MGLKVSQELGFPFVVAGPTKVVAVDWRSLGPMAGQMDEFFASGVSLSIVVESLTEIPQPLDFLDRLWESLVGGHKDREKMASVSLVAERKDRLDFEEQAKKMNCYSDVALDCSLYLDPGEEDETWGEA